MALPAFSPGSACWRSPDWDLLSQRAGWPRQRLARQQEVGALTQAGVSEEDAHSYVEGVRRGGTLVSARVADAASPQQVFLRHSRNERSYSQLDLLSKVPVSEALDERRMATTGTSSIPDD